MRVGIIAYLVNYCFCLLALKQNLKIKTFGATSARRRMRCSVPVCTLASDLMIRLPIYNPSTLPTPSGKAMES